MEKLLIYLDSSKESSFNLLSISNSHHKKLQLTRPNMTRVENTIFNYPKLTCFINGLASQKANLFV